MYKKSEVLRKIREAMQAGTCLTNAILATGLKTPYTVMKWRKKRPMIDRYIEACKELNKHKRIREVEDALYKNALGGNIVAQIFFLKNQRPNVWRDRQEFEMPKQTVQVFIQNILDKAGLNGRPNKADRRSEAEAGPGDSQSRVEFS